MTGVQRAISSSTKYRVLSGVDAGWAQNPMPPDSAGTRIGHDRLRCLCDLRNDRGRSTRRREQADEVLRDHPRQALLDGRRNVRRSREPIGRSHGENAQLAGAVELDDLRGDVGRRDGDLPADEIGDRGAGALVRDMHHIGGAGAT